MSEYNDCLSRAQRLSVARESHLAGNNTSLLSVKIDDLLIYLRWLVCHLHSIKMFNQFMRVTTSPLINNNNNNNELIK